MDLNPYARGPVWVIEADGPLVHVEIGLLAPPAWDAVVVPHGTRADLACGRRCRVSIAAPPERVVEVIDAIARVMQAPVGPCTATVVGPVPGRAVRRLRRAVRRCAPGEAVVDPQRVVVPVDPPTGALLAAAPGGLLRDRLRAEGLVYVVERDPDAVWFRVPAEARGRAEAVVQEVLSTVPAIGPARWDEARAVLEVDRLLALDSPALLAAWVEASVAAGHGLPEVLAYSSSRTIAEAAESP